MGEKSVLLSLPFVLRFFEMISSIVVFAVVADDTGPSKINYLMFVGISGFVLSFFFMVFYLAGNKAIRGKASAVIDGLWWVFWLAGAAVATNILTTGGSSSQERAVCAFAWIAWVLWTFSAIISVREVQGYEY